MMVEHVISRLKKITNDENIFLLTTTNKADNSYIDISKKNNIKIFRGSANNVLMRTAKCIKKNNIDLVVRVCGDRPFFDIFELDKYVKYFEKNYSKFDFLSSEFKRKAISGLVIEIIKSKAIVKINKRKISKDYKEHFTKFLYDNYQKFKIKKINSKFKSLNIKLSIDNEEDLEMSRYIVNKISKEDFYKTEKIINLYKKWFNDNKQ
tara:strand:+ start:6258 stop:6878 length:621 start_codon:yes stop_codon:yes gene_type:complete